MTADPSAIAWVPGDLGDHGSARDLVEGCDAVVHAALYLPADGFLGGEGDLPQFVETNVLGTIRLIEASRRAGVPRFVFISTCAVHDQILDDRPLDETHPLWPASHYGAHKAAIEAFVHSYGLGQGLPDLRAAADGHLRPGPPAATGASGSTWSPRSRGARTSRAGVAARRSTPATSRGLAALLLTADGVAGEAYNCYDRLHLGSRGRHDRQRTRPAAAARSRGGHLAEAPDRHHEAPGPGHAVRRPSLAGSDGGPVDPGLTFGLIRLTCRARHSLRGYVQQRRATTTTRSRQRPRRFVPRACPTLTQPW